MSHSHMFLKSGFPAAPLKNGIGRYIVQLQRVTLKFCKNHGSSRGIREFIETYLIDFAKQNPGVVVYVKPRRHRTPCIAAEYLNGEKHNLNCKDFNGTEVAQFLQWYVGQSGRQETRLRKMWHTDHPSIQGVWTPFTFRNPELNVGDLFEEKWSKPALEPPTASEQLIEMFKHQQLEENQDQKIQDDHQLKLQS